MKKLNYTLLLICGLCGIVNAQAPLGKPVPSADIKTLDGKNINTSTFSNNGKPIIISFWATWCKPCKKELDAIAEQYEEWVAQTGVKLIAVSIDDSRSALKVGGEVKSKDWKFDIYIDENQDFKRAMSVNSIPYTFILDGRGNIVWQHNSYAEGDEANIYEIIKKLASGEKLNE
ncbi:MAG TPA: TlpA disulfide reductase family protein [Bacteroidia bacterium]|jgi:peroxiredoxin|nr:TlpA disulfide reductase family protein [Bacteroidia bacterium]